MSLKMYYNIIIKTCHIKAHFDRM